MRKVALVLVALTLPLGAQGSPIRAQLPGADLRGEATFRYLGFPLYEAQLFTIQGAPLDWSEDFGLELTYLRNLAGHDLVEGTTRELNRAGSALPVRSQLQECFRDVRKGDRYTAISEGPNLVRFWLNGRQVCTLSYPQIKYRFMSIFLGDNTRSRSFTQNLRGE